MFIVKARGLRLAESARRGHRDFLGVADVGDVIRRLVASRRVADVHPLDGEARLDAAAAVDREDREHRAAVDVVDVGLQPGHRGQQVAVAADARQRAHRFVVERDLPLRALDVDDGRFAGDGDGLLHAADAQFAVDRDDAGPADDDTITPQGDEPRQSEGDRVGARPQVFHAVSSVVIRHRRADLLDQRRTGGFHRHAWQHGAGRISHEAGDGCLRPRRRLDGEEARQH